MSRQPEAARNTEPAPIPQAPVSVLPPHYAPKVAGYARGPFIDPVTVTPTNWRWRNARSFIVRDKSGQDYRCIRVFADGKIVGYWAVEKLGKLLPLADWA